ncbi:MAG: 30S ribosomal protein S20 [Caldisericales bacterium]|nr:30S ribosomal protein S20 [Caldisericales bacterium]
MLRHKAQQKSVRQSAKRHERNVAQKSTAKTAIKKALASLGTDEAQTNFQMAIKSLDKLESHGILHKNTVARKKSRLMARLNKSLQQA